MGQTRKTLKLEDIPRYEALLEAVKRAKKDMEKGKYRLKDLALVSVLIFTGCRLGEALKITLGDIDFKHKTIRIKQEKKRGEYVRVVPIPAPLFWEILGRYCKRIAHTDMPIFDISIRQARNIVYKFTSRYLRRKIRPHAIRHSYAVFVLKHTKDLEAVRRLLGHSDYKWLKVYLNYTQEDLEDMLQEAFEEVNRL